MSEHHPYRVPISPIPNGTLRPMWSVMIPTYNCARYLRDTLRSVLVQDPGPQAMQIEVIDDHSTEDDPEAVVRELGGDRVGFYRQAENVGHVRNFNTCLQRSRGRLIHLLHGDDCVQDGFYRKMQRAFDENAEIGAAFCRHIYMDRDGKWLNVSLLEQPESGILDNWFEKIAAGQRLSTPAMVVRRDAYERIGGYDHRISCYGEDWEMWVRVAAHYPVWFEVEPLAIYRSNSPGSLTERSVPTGADTRDLRLVTEIVRSYLPMYLPATVANDLANKARYTYACWALEVAHEVLVGDDISTAVAQMREALKCDHSWSIVRKVLYLSFDMGKHLLWRQVRIATPLVKKAIEISRKPGLYTRWNSRKG